MTLTRTQILELADFDRELADALESFTNTAPNATLVFRPGMVAQPTGGNVFNTWEALEEQKATMAGPKIIYFDTSIQVTGSGDSITADSPEVGTATLTDAAGLFTPAMVGQSLTIAGATSSLKNNGLAPFVITAYISPTQITYANANAVTEAYAGTWTVGTACVIPPGTWDQTDCMWFGTYREGRAFVNDLVLVGEGVFLPNLQSVGGELTVTNVSVTTVPCTLPGGTGGSTQEWGLGLQGEGGTLNNVGPAPFWDISAFTSTDRFSIKASNQMGGRYPAIRMGSSACTVSFIAWAGGRLSTDSIIGGATTSRLTVLQLATGNQIQRQPQFNGTIFHGIPGVANVEGLPGWTRQFMQPQGVNQLPGSIPIVPYVFATGLGMNSSLRLNADAGAITQPLPLIRAENTPPGLQYWQGQGVLDSASLTITVKETGGANAINLYGDSPISGAGGGAAAFTVTAANAVTFTASAGTPFLTSPTNALIGKIVTFAGATSSVNNGPFVITAVGGGGATITFSNTLGTIAVAEAFPAAGTWYVGNPAGTGDSFAFSAGTVTLTDSAARFTALMVGRYITIAGSTTPGNDGSFLVASVPSSTTLTFANASGATEAFTGTWKFNDTIDGGQGPLVVPAGGSRTLQSDGISNWVVIGGYL